MSNVTHCANRYCDSYTPESTALCRICNDLARIEREVPLYSEKQNYTPGEGRRWDGRRWDE